jgi:hypothetical protein
MPHPGTRAIVPPRSLTPGERAILDLLLATDLPSGDALRQQLGGARVSEECTCGCPSILFSIDHVCPAVPGYWYRVPVEAETVDRDGTPIWVLLHLVNGYMRELEILRADSAPVRLPDASALTVSL